jgi:hypothetical protein
VTRTSSGTSAGTPASRLRALIAKAAPAHERLVASVRRALRKRLPTAHEVVYEYTGAFVISFSPDARGYEGVLAIRGDAKGVRLYFNRGKGLPDPEKLLRGSGTQVRYILLEGPAALRRPGVARLIDAAIAGTRIPFAPGGRGPVVIRSSKT